MEPITDKKLTQGLLQLASHHPTQLHQVINARPTQVTVILVGG